METEVVMASNPENYYKRWTIAQLQPFIDVYKRSRQANGGDKKVKAPNDQNQSNLAESSTTVTPHMTAQRKKVLLKRESDRSFGFLKIETSIKPESRLKMRRMIKNNQLGNLFDLSDKLEQ